MHDSLRIPRLDRHGVGSLAQGHVPGQPGLGQLEAGGKGGEGKDRREGGSGGQKGRGEGGDMRQVEGRERRGEGRNEVEREG